MTLFARAAGRPPSAAARTKVVTDPVALRDRSAAPTGKRSHDGVIRLDSLSSDVPEDLTSTWRQFSAGSREPRFLSMKLCQADGS